MACSSCKNKTSQYEDLKLKPEEESKPINNFKYYFAKIIIFLFMCVVLIPFIIPILVIVLFKVVVLSKGVDISPLLKYIGGKIFKKNDEIEVEEENVEITEDEYELENKYDIVKID